MNIVCCYGCENRHEKCHSHCEEYITQKMLKIIVEAREKKDNEIQHGLKREKERRIAKIEHMRHLRRQK